MLNPRLNCDSVEPCIAQLLQELNSGEDGLFRATHQTNHALWFVGHISAADNITLRRIATERRMKDQKFVLQFAMGKNLVADAEVYPSISDIRRLIDEQPDVLLEGVDCLTEDDASTSNAGSGSRIDHQRWSHPAIVATA